MIELLVERKNIVFTLLANTGIATDLVFIDSSCKKHNPFYKKPWLEEGLSIDSPENPIQSRVAPTFYCFRVGEPYSFKYRSSLILGGYYET